MSRGGRRRRGRRGPRPDQPAKPQSQGQQQTGARPGGRRRRRRGSGGGEPTGFAAAVKEMSFRQATLQTLPDDGQVLDEVIGDLKTEYGVPATPQEYRLFIKIPVAEEASEKVAVEAVRVDPRDEEASVDGEVPKARRRRRGRRRRRPGSGESDTATPDGVNDLPADDGSPGADDAGGGTI
ncbi:MAG TPA: hypothetical protein VNA87_07515 [Actinomycetota bacterium]|nr:hypothetical protein [Actinomycetota bacterium]